MNNIFCTFLKKTFRVTGCILHIELGRSAIADIALFDARRSIIILICKNLIQNLCKLTEKCLNYITKELLNQYWWITALVGLKIYIRKLVQLVPVFTNISFYHDTNIVQIFLEHDLLIIIATLFTSNFAFALQMFRKFDSSSAVGEL